MDADDDDWLGWPGVEARIENAYWNAILDFAVALGEVKL